MPWKESHAVSERVKFIARLLEGEKMSDLCREFGISRKTGYKIFDRYRLEGAAAFEDQSRRPHRHPNRIAEGIVRLITEVRERHGSWGAGKIRDHLAKKHPGAHLPAVSTIHVILERNSLIQKRRSRKRFPAKGTALSDSLGPNDLWCADFKGQFRLGNQSYCYPLTVSDHWSRYVLCIEALEGTREDNAKKAFENAFREYGLPLAIRTDNGVPFSTRTLFGLSKLSVWWLRLGIRIQRIQPGHPEQNGRHERMHLTLKQATTLPPGKNILQQQEIFEEFKETFNQERPHDGIGKRYPAEIYKKSIRLLPEALPDPEYPGFDKTLRVSRCGSLCLDRTQRVFMTAVLGGQLLGLKRIDDRIWSTSFMKYELGYFDEESYKFTPKGDPFSAEETPGERTQVSPMSPE